MSKEKIKLGKGKKKERKENVHRREKEKKNRHLIFLLSGGDKRENFKFIFNTINCLMKHNNLSC